MTTSELTLVLFSVQSVVTMSSSTKLWFESPFLYYHFCSLYDGKIWHVNVCAWNG